MSYSVARRVLIIAVVCGLLLGLFPDIDLFVANIFYNSTLRDFPLRLTLEVEVVRRSSMLLIWIIATASVFMTILQVALGRYGFAQARKTLVYLVVSMLLGPGIIVNAGLKNYWGRPRPIEITEFGGSERFTSWWDPTGTCTANCSFVAGESATAFWTIAPASLLPQPWSTYGYAIAVTLGLFTGLLRMAFGAHFLSDVIFSGIIIYFTVWLTRRLLLCKPSR